MESIKLWILNNKKIFIWLLIFISIVIFSFNLKRGYISIPKKEAIILDKNDDLVYTSSELFLENNDSDKQVIELISVDIKGHVKKPGVYQVDKNKDRRVSDIVALAGGLLSDASTQVTNLAKKVFDEMVIVIYSQEEVLKLSEVLEKEKQAISACQKDCDSCINDKNESLNLKEQAESENSKLININMATKEELMTLEGIGESRAEAIIEYRKQTPFTKIEDIMKVAGIKESAYEKIKNNITI